MVSVLTLRIFRMWYSMGWVTVRNFRYSSNSSHLQKEIFPFGDTLADSGACVVRLWSASRKEWRLVVVDDFLPLEVSDPSYLGKVCSLVGIHELCSARSSYALTHIRKTQVVACMRR